MTTLRNLVTALALAIATAACGGDTAETPESDPSASDSIAPGMVTGTTGAPGPGTAGTPGTPAATDPDTIGESQ